ncbi:MAG: 3-dehydroquinate synthase [Verrucomicrobia bacterium]|nr:3-dehydroquinate synthase [Verrucomicrobiota bacterium]
MRRGSEVRISARDGLKRRSRCGEAAGATPEVQRNLAIERQFQVGYRHRVYFTDDVFGEGNPLLRTLLIQGAPGRVHKALVTLDAALAQAQPALSEKIAAYFARHPDSHRLVCPPLAIEGGEPAKNSALHVNEIHARLERHGICRHSYVVAVGGGAHLDVVGFAAATAHRGVRHVRVPSTTLAQADSGVGVKNGINAFGKKNFLGTFAPPFAVINDFQLLSSLSARDRRAGMVEAVKVALIRDGEFFAAIEARAPQLAAFHPEAVRWLIHRCAELHVHHIASSGDPFEFGSARPLDFGHWAAHKLEQMSAYTLRHGEAVAVGIALDTLYSARRVGLDPGDAERVLRLLERLGFSLWTEELLRREATGRLVVLAGLEEFREHLGGELTITLIEAIGRGREVHALDEPAVLEAIDTLERRAQSEPRAVP